MAPRVLWIAWLVLLLAGCDEGPPAGLCSQDPVEEGYCEVHGGEGLLQTLTIDLKRPDAASPPRTVATWEAYPHGFSEVQWGGLRGDRVYLYSASEGRLRRGQWRAGEVEWEPADVFIPGRFDEVLVEHYGSLEGGYDLALFVDSFGGRAESWRISEDPEWMWSHEDPRWRGRGALNWLPKASQEPSVLASAPGTSQSLAFSLTTHAAQTLNHAATERRSLTHRGDRHFGLTRERMSSGSATPTRLRVFEVDAMGNEVHPIFELEEDDPAGELQLVAHLDAQYRVSELLVWRYQSRTGEAELLRIDAHSGELLATHQYALPYHWARTHLRAVGDELRVLGLDAEGMTPLPRARLEAMVASVQQSLQHRVGYQFILAQSGRILHEEAGGWARLPSDEAPLGWAMTTDRRMNVASISKLVTAITVLRLVDAGRVDLDRQFIDYLSEERRKEVHPSWSGLTVRELLNHKSAIPGRECDMDENGVPRCAQLLGRERELWRCSEDEDGHPCCPSEYRNGNYHLLRYMLSHLLGLEDNTAVARYTNQDWLEGLGIIGAGCAPSPEDAYYRRSAPTTQSFAEIKPRRGDGCGQSGWHLNAHDIMRIARAIRYGWVLSEEMTAELLSCGEFGWLAWDHGFTHMTARAKNGRLDNADYAVQTLVMRLPDGLDLVLMTNNADPGSLGPVAEAMWRSY